MEDVVARAHGAEESNGCLLGKSVVVEVGECFEGVFASFQDFVTFFAVVLEHGVWHALVGWFVLIVEKGDWDFVL